MNAPLWLLALFTCITASLHAWMEIEIEGPDGWAAKLPTKRYDGKVARLVFGVPITRYHLVMLAAVFTFAHLPAFFIQPWTLGNEFIVLGYVILHFTLEDFLWFVFNPAFGLRKFKRENIWWHSRWFLGLPMAYWTGFPAGAIFWWLSSLA